VWDGQTHDFGGDAEDEMADILEGIDLTCAFWWRRFALPAATPI
jgi:hypothetical protein